MSVPSLSHPSEAQPRARRSSNTAVSRGDPLLFTVVDEVIEKLKLLDYEDRFCVSRNISPLKRSFFADQSTRGSYFPTFSALVLWLLSECLKHDFIEWTEFDDPTAIANSILEECKILGFSPKSKPTDLISGSAAREMGEIINHLSSKALSQLNFSVQAATYPQPEQTNDLDDADAIDEDDIQDDVGSDEDDIGVTSSSSSSASSSEDDFEDEMNLTAIGSSTVKGSASSKKSSTHKTRPQSAILKPKVDPRAWLMELERVESRLKLRAPPTSLEWRTHLVKSTTHSATLGRIFPDAKTRFNKIAQRLSESAQRISTKETHINQEFSHVCAEFREKQTLLKTSSDKCNALNEEVSALATRLETVSDEVEMTQAQMDTRNSSMTDMSPLRQIQDALSSLRKELSRIDLRVGVTRQALLAAKSIEQKNLRNESRLARRNTNQGGLNSSAGRGRGGSGARSRRARGGSSNRRGPGRAGLPRSSKVTSLRARGRDKGSRNRNTGDHRMSSSGVSNFLRNSSSSSRENSERGSRETSSRGKNKYSSHNKRSTNRTKPLAARNRAAGPPPPQSTRLDMSALTRFPDGSLKAATGRRGAPGMSSQPIGDGHDDRPESRRPGEHVSRQNSVRGL